MTETLADLSVRIYSFLLPISWMATALILIVFLPLSLAKRSRPLAGAGLITSSFIFGLTTWMLGATVTFAVWGWIGFAIGVLFLGVGVVPIAIAAAIFKIESASLAISLVVMIVMTYGTRWAGLALADQASSNQESY